MNRHSFRCPSLHYGGGMPKKRGDLLPALEYLRIALWCGLLFRVLRHDKEMHSHSAELGRKAASSIAGRRIRRYEAFFFALNFAQRARCALAIRWRAAAESLRFPVLPRRPLVEPWLSAAIARSSLSRSFFNCANTALRSVIVLLQGEQHLLE